MKHFSFHVIFALALAAPQVAFGATLYFVPQTQDVYAGESFVSEIRIDTEGEEVNAIDARISSVPDRLRFLDFTSGGSVFPLTAEGPAYDEASGALLFQAGVPKGYKGNGIVGRMFFAAREAGPASLRFGEGTQVLLNDGRGTPAVLVTHAAEYRILPRPSNLPDITSEDHPDENTWYSAPFIRMSWKVKEGAQYSYLLTRIPSDLPDVVIDEPIGDIKLTTQEDGIFYFRLRECVSGVCGPAATRRALKDTVPPEPFQALVGQDPTLFEGEKFLSFSATDATSGIAHYEVREERIGAWKVAESPYRLEYQGREKVQVKAVDRAGNERVVEVLQEERAPVFSRLLSGLFFLLVLFLAALYLFWKKRKK